VSSLPPLPPDGGLWALLGMWMVGEIDEFPLAADPVQIALFED